MNAQEKERVVLALAGVIRRNPKASPTLEELMRMYKITRKQALDIASQALNLAVTTRER